MMENVLICWIQSMTLTSVCNMDNTINHKYEYHLPVCLCGNFLTQTKQNSDDSYVCDDVNVYLVHIFYSCIIHLICK